MWILSCLTQMFIYKLNSTLNSSPSEFSLSACVGFIRCDIRGIVLTSSKLLILWLGPSCKSLFLEGERQNCLSFW